MHDPTSGFNVGSNSVLTLFNW